MILRPPINVPTRTTPSCVVSASRNNSYYYPDTWLCPPLCPTCLARPMFELYVGALLFRTGAVHVRHVWYVLLVFAANSFNIKRKWVWQPRCRAFGSMAMLGVLVDIAASTGKLKSTRHPLRVGSCVVRFAVSLEQTNMSTAMSTIIGNAKACHSS